MKHTSINYAQIIGERYHAASEYFAQLCDDLKDTHEVVRSCNGDFSTYLIPKGSIDQLSYYGKPADSYRLSDHWNWYSSPKRCKNPQMIQCHNLDVCPPRKRIDPDKATIARKAIGVAYFDEDHKYHMIFGEVFNWNTRQYDWKG